MSRNFTFKIKFPFSDKPIFSTDAKDTYTVEEGGQLLINLTAKANPDAIDYKWTDPDKSDILGIDDALPETRLVAIQGALNITSARKEDRGKYKVKASNEEGKTVHKFMLEVHYQPR